MSKNESEPMTIVFDDAEDDVGRALRAARRILFKYPMASQAAIRALAAEGRAFRSTPEGDDLALRLLGSDLVRRARVVWDVATANSFSAADPELIPSAVLEAVAAAAAQAPLESWLARELERGDE